MFVNTLDPSKIGQDAVASDKNIAEYLFVLNTKTQDQSMNEKRSCKAFLLRLLCLKSV